MTPNLPGAAPRHSPAISIATGSIFGMTNANQHLSRFVANRTYKLQKEETHASKPGVTMRTTRDTIIIAARSTTGNDTPQERFAFL